MNSDVLAALIEGAFVLAMGTYCTLLGYRVIGKKPGESLRYDEWHAKWGHRFRWLGPLIGMGGVVFAVVDALRRCR